MTVCFETTWQSCHIADFKAKRLLKYTMRKDFALNLIKEAKLKWRHWNLLPKIYFPIFSIFLRKNLNSNISTISYNRALIIFHLQGLSICCLLNSNTGCHSNSIKSKASYFWGHNSLLLLIFVNKIQENVFGTDISLLWASKTQQTQY